MNHIVFIHFLMGISSLFFFTFVSTKNQIEEIVNNLMKFPVQLRDKCSQLSPGFLYYDEVSLYNVYNKMQFF